MAYKMDYSAMFAWNPAYVETGRFIFSRGDETVALDPIFGLIRKCEDGRDVMSLLKGPVCHGGFKRLN